MNFPWFSDKSWRRLVCFFAAAVIWRIFLLFAFSDGWIGFFLAEIVHPFGWIWRFGRFSRPFSTHSLWFFHVCLKKVGLTLSLRDLCSESLVMHSLFIRQSFTQIGPLKPRNSKKNRINMGKLIKNRKTSSIEQIIWSCFYKKITCNQLEPATKYHVSRKSAAPFFLACKISRRLLEVLNDNKLILNESVIPLIIYSRTNLVSLEPSRSVIPQHLCKLVEHFL